MVGFPPKKIALRFLLTTKNLIRIATQKKPFLGYSGRLTAISTQKGFLAPQRLLASGFKCNPIFAAAFRNI